MNKFEKDPQEEEPFLQACIDYMKSSPTPFDVPGHKLGGIKTDLVYFAGENIFDSDFNAPIGLDNLYHPQGVIKKAEALAAQAFNADECLFSVNGSTGGIITLLCAVLDPKDKIILPRNVHKSAINGLIVSGAYPIFISPDLDEETGIANGVDVEEYVKAMDENPDVKALFVINPTYFGIVSDLKSIVKEAHKRGVVVICDEAHGAHFHFSKNEPCSAMDAGADLSILSIHKTGGSLTQSSMILGKGDLIDWHRVTRVFSMFSSTSPNHLLLASLDAARKFLYFQGKEYIDRSIRYAEEARKEISKIPGLSCIDDSFCSTPGRYGRDKSKLVINVSGLGKTGFEIYREIREKFNIQLELGEAKEVMALFGIGTLEKDKDILIKAFKELSKEYYQNNEEYIIPNFEYHYPKLLVRPREAFYAPYKVVKLEDAVGEICAESIMVYPPGIPVLIPGELISSSVIDILSFYEDDGGVLLSDSKDGYIKVVDKDKWYKAADLYSQD